MTRRGGGPVIRQIYIDAPPAAVFGFFVEPAKLTRWLAREATLDPRAGGACIQVHDGGPDRGCGPFQMQGSYLVVDPPNRVSFTWGFAEPGIGVPPGSSTVEVTLHPVGAGTRVELVHRDLPPTETENHDTGWAAMLDRLAHAATTHKEGSEL